MIIPAVGSMDGVWAAISPWRRREVLLFIVALVIRVLLAPAYRLILPGLSLVGR